MGSEQRKDIKNGIRIEEGQQKWDQNRGRTTKMGSEQRKDNKKWDQHKGRTTKMGSEHRKNIKNGIRLEEGQQK